MSVRIFQSDKLNGNHLIAQADVAPEVTLEKAQKSREFHYTAGGMCSRTFGPKGRVTDNVTRCRESGQTKTWKTRPTHFRQPVKFGLYRHDAITHENAGLFHTAEDCPLQREDFPRTRADAEIIRQALQVIARNAADERAARMQDNADLYREMSDFGESEAQ